MGRGPAPTLLEDIDDLGKHKKPKFGWPDEVEEIVYQSPSDESDQAATIYVPDSTAPVPLLIDFHGWSQNYQYPSGAQAARWCIDSNWAFLYPDFRGASNHPDGLCSEHVVHDILGAIASIATFVPIDRNRIYLLGGKTAGHVALYMAGRAPDVWAGVSVWGPWVDLKMWWKERIGCRKNWKYAGHIELACGGKPSASEEVAEEYELRSPITWLQNAVGVPIDLNAGLNDGRIGPVAYRHSLHAYNELAADADRFSDEEIEHFYNAMRPPKGTPPPDPDPLYGSNALVFRGISNNVRLTIFRGGHKVFYDASLNWLAQQRRGEPAVWKCAPKFSIGG